MLKLVIGNKNYSSWSLRPWILLRQGNISFQELLIPLYEDDSRTRIRELSPTGKVPCLIHDTVAVWDSLAICEYLNEVFPERHFWPEDLVQRAHARSISAEMHSGFAGLRAGMPMNVRKVLPGKGKSPQADADIARIVDIWEGCLKTGAGQGGFLFGAFSIADAMYAPVCTRMRTYGVDLPAASQAYVDRVLGLPAMLEWYAAGRDETWVLAMSEL